MPLLKIERTEGLLPDQNAAMVKIRVTLFGIPIYEDSNFTTNENILCCFKTEEPHPTGFYDHTSMGFIK